MNQIAFVRVRAEHPWRMAQVDGVRFYKDLPTQLHAHELTHAILESPLLEVEYVPVVAPAPLDAEPARKGKRGTK